MAQALLHAPDDVRAAEIYRSIIWNLREAGIPYLVGGTYALEHHAGLVRATKDLDLFVRRADWSRITETLAPLGVRCELVFSHWLGKAYEDNYFVDMIFAGGNGLVEVDDDWLSHGVPSVVLDVPVHLAPAEEMIWSKSFVMERERFDGADVTHILRKSGPAIDWVRLLRRYGPHAPILLAHLVMFQFVYPGHRANVPEWVIEQVGTPDDVYDHPASPFVLEFLGHVNRWTGSDARSPAYVRPHEIRVLAREELGSLPARLVHGAPIGANARLEFAVDGAGAVNVELSREAFRELQLQPGDVAWLKPLRVRQFEGTS